MMKNQPKTILPDIYDVNWLRSEKDINVFVEVYTSPDLSKPNHLTEEQRRFTEAMLTGDYDEGWLAGGNSSGKTWTAKFIATMFAVHKIKPGKKSFSDYDEFQRTPYNILCTGPESKQAMELWEAVEATFKNSPILKLMIEEIHTGTKRNIHPYMKTTDGVIIEAIGLQDKGKHIEGQAYDLILINEPADVRNLIHCYEKVLVPRTWRRGGIVCGFGTPKGKNEYYSLWRRGELMLDGVPNKYWEPRIYSQYSDSRTNKFADQEKISRSMEGKNAEWVLERIEGKFADSKFAAFKDSDIEACIEPKLKNPLSPSSNHTYVHGVDFGRKGDFTGCVTWDVSVFPHVQVNIYRAGGGALSWENIFEDILKIHKRWGGEFVYDATGSSGDIQGEWLNDLGIFATPYQFGGSPGKKLALINNLQDYIAKRLFRMPSTVMTEVGQLVDELRQYPANMDDKDIVTDMVFSLALCAWGARNYEPGEAVESLHK